MGYDKPHIITLMGPTASGKTDLALLLAEHLPCEIVSVDSALVYRGLDIGTAKPSRENLAATPHHLIDILDPVECYSAAQFRADALEKIAEILARERIPLLVGGTMLYFRALLQGLSQLPPADAAVRARLDRDAKKIGWRGMHEWLSRVDPDSAKRIHPNDPQRIQRALEVYELTGVALTALCRQEDASRFPYQDVRIVVAPTARLPLHRRIAERFKKMLELGFVEEVEALRRNGDLHDGLPAVRAVGYRQVWGYLDGRYGYQEMVEKATIATRQLAKRQMTWLRRERGAAWFDMEVRDTWSKVLKFLESSPIN